MVQIIRSVSINPEQAKFLDENKELSLSKICQVKINDMMNDSTIYQSRVIQLERANSTLSEALKAATDKLDQLNCELEDGKWIGIKKSARKDT